MNFKDKIKRKIGVAIAAMALTVGGVAVGALPAMADTYDCFPSGCSGYYKSVDVTSGGVAYAGAHFGYDAAPESGSGAIIDWGSNYIHASGPVKDVNADGKGAIGQIQICPGGNQLCSTESTHVTAGSGNYKIAYAARDNINVNDSSVVYIRTCNGYDAAGNPENCENWHGPFHRY